MNGKIIITYGTFDLLHYGHIELLRRCSELGDFLIVGLSSDEFNKIKGKKSHFNYKKRKEMLEVISYVDKIIPENNWGQKQKDIKSHNVDVFVMGDDWTGKFDELREFCEVMYISRTPSISSTAIKKILKNDPAIPIINED